MVWARRVAEHPGRQAAWQDTERLDRYLLAGMDALVEALASGRPEPFAGFAGRLSQEAFSLRVPLHEVVRTLLPVRGVILDFVTEGTPALEVQVEVATLLDRLVTTGVLEAIGTYDRHRDRRESRAREQVDLLRERVRRENVVDPQTGLHNATFFRLALRREVVRSRRFHHPFTVGIVALDGDEELLASLGEDGLGSIIVQLASIIGQSLRGVDLLAALGGYRLGLILPETALDGARAAAERILRRVENSPFEAMDSPWPTTRTVSIGLASYPIDGQDDETLMARAEEALARARALGNVSAAAARASDL